MFKNSFSFKGRIRRTEYGISLIICTGIILITNALALSIKGPVPVFIIYIPLLWFLLAQGAKRCHDIGKTGWYQIIPFYVFWMLFTASHKGINENGINPKGKGNEEQNIIVTKKEQYTSGTTSQTPSQYKRFDLPAEESDFLTTIKRKWGNGTEFFAGDAFSLISEEYLNWYTKEAESKNVLSFNHRESATLELLEKFRIQGLLTKRVDDDKWYYLFSNKLPVTETSNSKLCKAYKNGRCISKTGSDSGPCSWKPVDWKNCGVVVESEKLYGLW